MAERRGTYIHLLRRLVQMAVIAAAIYTGARLFWGLGLTTVEKYCPMGGLATAWSLIFRQRFSCATGEFNFALAIALLLSALLVRKAFCSWICPIGTVSELVGRGASWLRSKVARRTSAPHYGLVVPGRRVDGAARWLRLGVLALIVYATAVSGELLFRPFCPYYVMFSFHGHEVQMWSYALLAVFVAGIVVAPMIWCRYLCPLGGAIWPLSKAGLIRLRRGPHHCTNCGLCDRACPHSIEVSKMDEVRSGECTLCLECTRVCPTEGALQPTIRPTGRPLPRLAVPAILLILTLAGLAGGSIIVVPSFAREYNQESDAGQTRTVSFTVDGVRCVDTAEIASTVFDGFDGILSFTAYGSRNEVVLEYDAAVIGVEMLKKIMEGPVHDEESGQFVFHVFKVLEIDGHPVAFEKK